MHEISARVEVYPQAVRERIRADVDAYVGYVVNDEWTLTMELIRGTDLLEHLSFAEIQSAVLDPAESEAFDPDAVTSHRYRSERAASDQSRRARAGSRRDSGNLEQR